MINQLLNLLVINKGLSDDSRGSSAQSGHSRRYNILRQAGRRGSLAGLAATNGSAEETQKQPVRFKLTGLLNWSQ